MTNMESINLMKRFNKLDINSCVVVKVTRIEDYVVFVDKDGIAGLIQVTDLSWSDNVNPHDLLRIGDEVEAKITMIDFESSRKEKFRASIKAMRPQDNPWKDPSVYSMGKVIEGNVTKKTPFGYLILMGSGVHALLPLKDTIIKKELPLNAAVKVKIEKVDVELKKIEVSFVESVN